MQFETTDLSGVVIITPKRFSDDRGFFSETFKLSTFHEQTGLKTQFVQDNFSLSKPVGTLRGLHYQTPPHAQGKLVQCMRGEILDVVVDWRKSSPTFGQHVSVVLSPNNARQIWVPAGFLHGFITRKPNTEVAYKVTDYYAPECDGNIAYDDPELAIDWGMTPSEIIISSKDAGAPKFSVVKSPF